MLCCSAESADRDHAYFVAGGCECNRCCHLHAEATAWGYGIQAGADLWCYVHWCPLPDLHSPASLAASGFVLGSCKLCTAQLLPFNFWKLYWWLPWMVMRLELSGLGNPWREARDVECYPPPPTPLPQSRISGLSFDSPVMSCLLFFCLVLLLFCLVIFFANGPFSWFLFWKILEHFFWLRRGLFCMGLVKRLGGDSW